MEAGTCPAKHGEQSTKQQSKHANLSCPWSKYLAHASHLRGIVGATRRPEEASRIKECPCGHEGGGGNDTVWERSLPDWAREVGDREQNSTSPPLWSLAGAAGSGTCMLVGDLLIPDGGIVVEPTQRELTIDVGDASQGSIVGD